MRAKEFITDGIFDIFKRKSNIVDIPGPNPGLMSALRQWNRMENTSQSQNIILNSPAADAFKNPPSGVRKIYRVIVLKNRTLTDIKSSGQVVVYSTSLEGAEEFVRTLGIQDKSGASWVIVAKKFYPKDMLLNFEAMIVKLSGRSEFNEDEIWMKPTFYYTTYNDSEIIKSQKIPDNHKPY
jgi:hypothetical protein